MVMTFICAFVLLVAIVPQDYGRFLLLPTTLAVSAGYCRKLQVFAGLRGKERERAKEGKLGRYTGMPDEAVWTLG